MAAANSYSVGSSPTSVTTQEGINVELVTGSIVDQKADVIVNITSPSLDLDGGTISKAILLGAGSDIQDECNDDHPGGVKFGNFVETSGGNLECDAIYHGSLNNWNVSAGDKILRQLIQSMLSSADTDRRKSIVFPALGTGNLGYPRDKVATAMYGEIASFSTKNSGTTLKKIVIVLHSKDTENIKVFKQHIACLVSGTSNTGASGIASNFTLPLTFKLGGGFKVTVKKSDITKEQVDVVVNSTGHNLMLNDGTLSRAILAAAGNSVQQECTDNKPSDFSHGDVVSTSGGNMPVKALYHGSLSEWQSGKGEKDMRTFISNCLEEADGDDMKSIALPAIGTGVLKFPHKESARILYKEIKKYCKANPDYDVKDIRIIVHDTKTVKAFEQYFGDKMAKRQSKSSVTGNTASPKSSGAAKIAAASPRTNDPFVDMLQGLFSSPRSVSTPAVVMSDVASFSTPSGTNVQIRKGTLTQEKADVIVNVVGKDLNLNHGAITSTIRKAAGNIIEQECKTNAPNGVAYGEVVSTSGGAMNCKAIYHGAVPNWYSGNGENTLRALMDVILSKADQAGYNSVALPSIGTGLMLGYPADVVAMCMMEEITKYSTAHPSSGITHVKVVLYEKDTRSIKAFEDQLQQKSSTTTGTKPKNTAAKLPTLPTSWEQMTPSELYKAVQLSPTSTEYKDVAKKFVATGGPDTIQKIERIQCPNMYQLYLVRKVQMESSIRNKKKFPAERILYHGTTEDVLDSINLLGFNRSFNGKNATMYGYGTYFAMKASYSAQQTYSPPDKSKLRHIYQCRVLTGEFTAGSSGMKTPPPKDPNNASVQYDTVVDSVRNPGIFVVFYDAQSYPEYHITFK